MNKRLAPVRVRPETYEKLDRIRTPRRWTYSTTVDALCDAFLAAEESTPRKAQPRPRSRANARGRL